MIFEPILFGITGANVKVREWNVNVKRLTLHKNLNIQINELDPHIVSVGIGILTAAAVIRILSTIAIAVGDKLNLKEKVCRCDTLFVSFSV